METFQSAIACHQQGNLAEAKKLYAAFLQGNPDHFDALHLSGIVAFETKEPLESIELYTRAFKIRSDFAPLYSNFGNTLKALKLFDEALASYDKAIALKSDYAEAFYNRGVTFQELNRFNDALASYEQAIAIEPDLAEAYANHGLTLKELRRFDEALASYQHAILVREDYADVFNNRGIALKELKRFDEALASYDQAVAIKPGYADSFNNRGVALQDLKRFNEALASYDRAIAIEPGFAEAYANRGTTLKELKLFDEALTSYEHAILLQQDYEYLFGTYLHFRMQTSKWSGLEELLAFYKQHIEEMNIVTPPFAVLGLFDDPRLHAKVARRYIDKRFPLIPFLEAPASKGKRRKIRVGYLSADFHSHATAYLMAELFERHDRDKFELVAFSFGPDAADDMRARLTASFDQFLDVRFQSDKEIADTSKTLEIDIAVDLKGFTQDARTGVFAHRCAPIQVNYIGYPGTMSAAYIDYIIADQVLIPPEKQQFYGEKIVYLPGTYQVNDSKRMISDLKLTRSELGLPQGSFVFCCFNNSYKILPATFDRWMRILSAVEGSVLWLLDDNAASNRNLQREATARGVSGDRLFFARRVPLADHLARHRCADLFLDTLPYNAHTTASDALWAGLPVLTRIGEAFAGRVAASLLNAVGLPELVTTSDDAYEQLAVRLATHPDELNALKQKLAANRLSCRLFDTGSYVRSLEAAYTTIHERHQAGLKPDHIYIED